MRTAPEASKLRLVRGPAGKTNLPAELNAFIGRGAERSEVARLLYESRIVTLTGAGGCGKTRLAQRLAAELADRHGDGAWWVDLAPLSDPGLVPVTTAAVLGVQEVPFETLDQTLARELRDKQLLVLLDNCEHLLSASAQLAQTLLSNCPGVTILTTSREPLALPGEVRWRMPPLSFPPAELDHDVKTIGDFEAVRLFVERAARVRPGFGLTDDNVRLVAEICRRLDGMPLAIELAAARVSAFSPREIAASLTAALRLLTGGARTALPRQQALVASIDWSYNLLTEHERALLRRLSVFIGGFTLEAAREVGCGGDIGEPMVLELLSTLVDKSLVQQEERRGESRYRLLETISQYAREKLWASGETPNIRARHLDWYLKLAEGAEPQLEGPQLPTLLEILDGELDNLRAAMDWSGESREVDKGLRLVSALGLFWILRNRLTEGRSRLEAALAAGVGSPSSRSKALVAASAVSYRFPDPPAAHAFAKEGERLARHADDRRMLGRALGWLGFASIFTDPEGARAPLEESIDLARELGDAFSLANSLNALGIMEVHHGDAAAARRALDESRSVARASGNRFFGLRHGLSYLGVALAQQGELAEAREVLEEGLSISRQVRDNQFAAFGLVAFMVGDYASAERLLENNWRLARDSGHRHWGARASMGVTAYARGDLAAARAAAEEALPFCRANGLRWMVAMLLIVLARSAEARADHAQARQHRDESLAVARESGHPWALGRCLLDHARIARIDGDHVQAETRVHEALAEFARNGDKVGIADALEALGGLAGQQDSLLEAARLLGAAASLRRTTGAARFAVDDERYELDVCLVREWLGEDEFHSAWEAGAGLVLQDALAYAARGRGERKRPAWGWASLTPTELEVVRLVARGFTNPQIAEKMFVAASTVKTHLLHVFAKLGVSSRAELAAQVVGQEL